MKRRSKRPSVPLFLPRPDYKLRRLIDAARLLPLLGGFFWLLPILWGPAETAARDTAPNGIYLFAVWAVLIGFAALFAPGLATAADDGVETSATDAGDTPQDDT